jgi:hypothetical protein
MMSAEQTRRADDVKSVGGLRRAARSTVYRAVAGGGGWIFLGFVVISKSSVRNGVTGRPSVEKRLQTGLSAQAYRTAIGAGTAGWETST